ncbi:MAG: helix-turn-helix transcriptional regulator [Lachnospiraceae bacterium]|nr:helix-turn-helix transcriptional regulator [Lachnospiraceae bacterium]
MDKITLGQFIARLRKEADMTQLELAEKLNVPVQAISKLEQVKGLPDINTIKPLADALGVSIMKIMKAERIPAPLQQQEEIKEQGAGCQGSFLRLTALYGSVVGHPGIRLLSPMIGNILLRSGGAVTGMVCPDRGNGACPLPGI